MCKASRRTLTSSLLPLMLIIIIEKQQQQQQGVINRPLLHQADCVWPRRGSWMRRSHISGGRSAKQLNSRTSKSGHDNSNVILYNALYNITFAIQWEKANLQMTSSTIHHIKLPLCELGQFWTRIIFDVQRRHLCCANPHQYMHVNCQSNVGFVEKTIWGEGGEEEEEIWNVGLATTSWAGAGVTTVWGQHQGHYSVTKVLDMCP